MDFGNSAIEISATRPNVGRLVLLSGEIWLVLLSADWYYFSQKYAKKMFFFNKNREKSQRKKSLFSKKNGKKSKKSVASNDVSWSGVFGSWPVKLMYIDEKSFSGQSTIVADAHWSKVLKNSKILKTGDFGLKIDFFRFSSQNLRFNLRFPW